MATKIQNGDTGLSVRTEINKLIPNPTRPTFNPSTITLTDKETYFSEYTQTGVITIAAPTNNFGVGASFLVLITTNASAINFPSGWAELDNDYATDSDNYILVAVFNGSQWTYSVRLWNGTFTDVTPPTLTSATVENATDTAIDLVFSEAVTLTNLGFSLSGITSAPTITSISGSGTTNITLNLSGAVVEADIPLISYDSSTGDCVYVSGNALASFTNTSVTNNVTDLVALTAPALSAPTVDSATQISVTITDNNTTPNEVNTLMQYKTQASSTWLDHGSAAQDATAYSYSALTAETAYDFRCIAQGDDVTTSDSSASNTVQGTTEAAIAQLTTPALNAVSMGVTTADLSWGNILNNVGYAVYYKLQSEPTTWSLFEITATDAMSSQITGLSVFTPYDFSVIAIADGVTFLDSDRSNIVQGTTLQATIPANPDGEWLMDGNALDTSVSGNDGTVVGAVLTTDNNGVADKAYSFDGVNDEITLGAKTYLFGTQPFTISFWIYINPDGANNPCALSFQTDMTTKPYVFLFIDVTAYNGMCFGDGGFLIFDSNNTVPDFENKWTHVCVTYGGGGAGTTSEFNLYLDGTLTTKGSAGPFSTYPNVNNFAKLSSTYLLDGKLSKIRVYSNYEANQTDVTAFYNE